MARNFPTVLQLHSALIAAIASLLTAIPIMFLHGNEHFVIGVYVWGSVWAMTITSVELRDVASDGIKSIVGTWLALCGAAFANYLGGLISSDTYVKPALAGLFSTPFALFILMAHPDVKFPVQRIIKWDIALICLYTSACFNRNLFWETSLNLALGVTIGCIFTMFTLICFHLTVLKDYDPEHELREAQARFQDTHCLWFEVLVEYFYDPGAAHDGELIHREREAARSYESLQHALKKLNANFFSSPVDSDALTRINNNAMGIHLSLIALRGALSREGFNSALKSAIAGPLSKIRLSILFSLRPNSDGEVCQSAIKQLASDCDLLQQTVLSLDYSQDCGTFPFATSCVVKLGEHVLAFLQSAAAPIERRPTWVSLWTHVKSVSHSLTNEMKVERLPKISPTEYVTRGVIGHQVLIQFLLLVKHYYENEGMTKYFSWSVVGYIITMLPTVGQAAHKGVRRILGTYAGSAVSALVGLLRYQHAGFYYLDMVIITFVGKLWSYHPVIQSGGIGFALCQIFETLPSAYVNDDSEILYITYYRTVTLTIGVGFSMLCAIVLYPIYSANRMRRVMATTIRAVGVFVSSPHRSHLSLHRQYASLSTLCKEAQSELFWLKNRNTIPPEIKNIINAETSIYRLADATSILALFAGPPGSQDERVGEEFLRASKALAKIIEKPTSSGSIQMSDCIVNWTGLIPQESESLEMLLHYSALTELFSAWDSLIRSLDPKLIFSSGRSRSGIKVSHGIPISPI